jgi:hypothetical protein
MTLSKIWGIWAKLLHPKDRRELQIDTANFGFYSVIGILKVQL